MVCASDKRREVAARLRAEAESWRSYREDDNAFCMNDCEFTEAILEDFDFTDMDMPAYEVFDQMADIVDRPTCHDVADFDRESFKCSRCGFRVLSIDGAPDAAKLVGTKGGVVDFGYCPNCGAMVTEGDGCDVREL